MPEQFETPEVTKPEDEPVADVAAEKKIEHIAEKAADKASKTEQNYDKDHTLFSN
jgi:hypothetical protein